MVFMCHSAQMLDFVLRAHTFRAWVRVKLFVWRGFIIPPTKEGPSPKRLVYKQLFDTFKSFLSLTFNLLLSVAREHLGYIIFLSLAR